MIARRRSGPRLVGVVVGAIVLGACSAVRSPAPEVAPSTSGSAELTPAEREVIWRARTDSARRRFSPADVRFMTGMIGHHAQALGMSNLAPTNGASATIRTLAARIINAQTDEIANMQRWLRDRGQPVPEVHVNGAQVMVHGAGMDHASHGQMPGMLTDEQLAALAAARDTAFDRLFLALMIQHHRGAVVMVDELFATDGAAQDTDVFKFASDVQVDQRTEVARMEQMLALLGASSARE
jgi:uncharacterized protein (DUF305 family)